MQVDLATPKVWLWLRGLTRDSEHWGKFREDFTRAFPSDRVVCLDLPGAGTKRLGTSPLAISEYTDSLRLDLQGCKIDQPIIALGLSMGGMILLDWLARFPGDFSGMVLINSSAANLGPPWQRLNVKVCKVIFSMLLGGKSGSMERSILELVSNDDAKRKIAEELWARIREQRPPLVANMVRQTVAAARFQLRPMLNPPPILILNSAGDRLVNPKLSVELNRRIPGTSLVTHPNAGHDLPIDDPTWILRQIATWRGL